MEYLIIFLVWIFIFVLIARFCNWVSRTNQKAKSIIEERKAKEKLPDRPPYQPKYVGGKPLIKPMSDAELNEHIIRLVEKDCKVHAIKLAREQRELGLREAKEYVENLMLHTNIELKNCDMKNVKKSIESVDGMDGHAFEYFCADLLRKKGFLDVRVTPGSGDQGVDVLATRDGVKYAIQCKNYASPLSNTPVQEVSAGKIYYNCHVGVVLTNSTFTPAAISLAKATGVLLWDRSILAKLMENSTEKIEHKSDPVDNTLPESHYMEGKKSVSMQTESMVYVQQQIEEQELSKPLKNEEHIRIDNIDIDIDTSSTNRFGIILDNFGIEIDEDDDDQVELLFDIIGKKGNQFSIV